MKTTAALGLVALLAIPALSHASCGLEGLDPVVLDRNGNGQISRDEAAGTALAWAFDTVDGNGDGVIDQPEFGARCASYTTSAASSAPRDPTVVERVAVEKAEEQKQRQQSRVGQRVDQEANNAVDGLIDRGLGRIFGR